MKYGSCAVFDALMVVFYLSLRDLENAELVDKFLYLADAFTIPGMLLILLGAMVWVSNQGALDGIAYCVRLAIYSLIPGKRVERDEKYGDYVERKRGKRVKGYGFLFFSGIATMLIAFVFMAQFYYLYG